jgi:SSS family solute:Na+ symporter
MSKTVPVLNPTLDIRSILSPFDWMVFFAILLITLAAIVYGEVLKRRAELKTKESFLDYLLFGRQLTLPLFVATLVATWYGGIFGVTQISFEYGIYNFITQGVFWYGTYLLFALVLVDKVRKYQAVTLPDLVGQMFGPKSEKLSALFNFINVIPVAYTISIGLLLQALFGGSLIVMSTIGVLFVVIYSWFGGFRAVVLSDVVQFIVMCLAVLLVLIYSVDIFGGIGFLKANLPSQHFSILGGHGILTTLSWGLIALSTLVDPNFYQRIFAAQTTKTARNGILISTVIWFCFDICTTAGGMYARAVIPEADSAQAYLIYALQILPDGVRGFFLAGVAATILSTLDSFIFIAGTTFSYDLLPKKWKNKVLFNHLSNLLAAIISIILASMFSGDIKSVWKTLGSYSAACLLVPIMCGHLFPGKISDRQFFYSGIIGAIATTYWRHWSQSSLDEIYIGSLATLVSLIIWTLIRNKSKIYS